ncbi:MAG: DUF2069 domain-containing protein [Oxalobacteraceae bacterium]|nr:MAG: DUF2069 domain-containing protein [Oxalobacteraceae bacterium]
MSKSQWMLALALFALSVLFSLWFHDSEFRIALMVFFTVPPLLLLVGVLSRRAKASFWSGVLGLFWFSHGVMEAYAVPAERSYAVVEIVLAVVIVLASSWSGLSARFGRKKIKGAA